MDPREVGSLLFSHPEVAEVCVLTEAGMHAFVVLAPKAAATLRTLTDLCRQKASKPEDFRISLLKAMPKTRTGAVDRARLLEMARSAAAKKNVA